MSALESVTAVIQARMGSSRMPGKVLESLEGRPILEWVTRAAQVAGVGRLIVATTSDATDDHIVDWCNESGVAVSRGPVDDVLTRFMIALRGDLNPFVMRLTADCPLLDPQLLRATGVLAAATNADYTSTVLHRTLPRGLDVEVVRRATLDRLDALATDYHRTHVTSWLHNHPDGFALVGLVVAPLAADLRVTVDTAEDLELVRAIAAQLGDRPPSWRETVELLRRRPDLVAINAHIEQKALADG